MGLGCGSVVCMVLLVCLFFFRKSSWWLGENVVTWHEIVQLEFS